MALTPDPFCTKKNPCWDQHGPHQVAFVSPEMLASAWEELYLLQAEGETRAAAFAIKQKAHDIIDLYNARWRACVRSPFDFGIAQQKKVGSSKVDSSINIFKLMNLNTVPEGFRRRV